MATTVKKIRTEKRNFDLLNSQNDNSTCRIVERIVRIEEPCVLDNPSSIQEVVWCECYSTELQINF